MAINTGNFNLNGRENEEDIKEELAEDFIAAVYIFRIINVSRIQIENPLQFPFEFIPFMPFQ